MSTDYTKGMELLLDIGQKVNNVMVCVVLSGSNTTCNNPITFDLESKSKYKLDSSVAKSTHS